MKREFLINIVFLISINLLIKPFYIFGIDRTIQNTVGAETYGIYFALFNFTFLLQILNDFGIQQFNNRSIAQHPQLLQKYFPNILILKLLLGFIYLAIVFITSWLSGYKVEVYHLIFFIALNHILISLVFYLRSNITGLGMYRTDSLISSLDKLLLIIFCSLLLWGNLTDRPFQIEWFVFAQNFSWIITALVAFIIVRKQLKSLQFRFNWPLLLSLLKKSYPFALVIFLMTVYTRIDAVMIERMLPDGKVEAGIYAAAYRLLDACSVIGLLFAGLLLPMFSSMLKKGENVQPLVRFSFQMIWAGAITLAVSVFFFREELMFWLYTGATPYYGKVLGYLILTLIAVSGIYIYSTLLTANGSLMKMNLLFTISIVINVVLNYFLIKNQKAAGAAIATLITQFFVLFGKMVLAKWEVGIVFYWKEALRIGLFIGAVTLTGYFSYRHLTFPWLVNFSITLLAGLAFAFVFRLIRLKMLFQSVRDKFN